MDTPIAVSHEFAEQDPASMSADPQQGQHVVRTGNQFTPGGARTCDHASWDHRSNHRGKGAPTRRVLRRSMP
jgi:hypothetical protein